MAINFHPQQRFWQIDRKRFHFFLAYSKGPLNNYMEIHRTTLSLYCTPTCTIYDETVTVTANFQSSSGSRPERGKTTWTAAAVSVAKRQGVRYSKAVSVWHSSPHCIRRCPSIGHYVAKQRNANQYRPNFITIK